MAKDVRPPLPFEGMAIRIGLRTRLVFDSPCYDDVLSVAATTRIQWILSVVDSIGTQLTVLYREVSVIQSVPYREVPLYTFECMCVVEGGAIISF